MKIQHALVHHQDAPADDTTDTPPSPAAQSGSRAPQLVLTHAQQEITTTASRSVRARDFLSAAQWAIDEGVHPQANATTLRVAQSLAGDMKPNGHVFYCRDHRAALLGISKRCLAHHIGYLRELGLLVWVKHGSRTNTRRKSGRPGWSGTATIYAATAPPPWDQAMGHRIYGHGYTARLIGYTPQGRARAITDARARKQAAARTTHCTPSRKQYPKRQKAQVDEKNNYTTAPERRAPRPTSFTPAQTAHSIAIATWIRPRVPWTQGEHLRRLAYALRPLITAGLTRHDIAAELHSWWLTWRPHAPAAYITRHLRDTATPPAPHQPEQPEQTQITSPPGVPPNAAFRAALAKIKSTTSPQRRPGPDGNASEPLPEEPTHRIHARILASLAQADAAENRRTPLQCQTLAQWETQLDTSLRTNWRETHPCP
ncbi:MULTISPECIES: hypothetical protein [unclassified Streptomyces]|uniref:hypothetical protein n=1 Tax=unclassified Streptomyces TaxID=2593676 RepID=UPI00131A1CD1|nr:MULTISPECIES: hypothetical protein [unclassified Streptomyces]MYX38064.1 hypothetical protein [Streptomyces sp. SID8377]